MRQPDRASRIAMLCVFVSGLLTACGSDSPSIPGQSSATVATDAAPARDAHLSGVDGERLRAAAARALHDKRLYAPAGDNAIEYYLAMVEKAPDAAVRTALVELQPYALIAAEQALAHEDLPEAQRLLALMERSDPAAPSLPRLRESLRQTEVRVGQRRLAEAQADERAREQQLQAQAELREPQATSVAARVPGASIPATTPASEPAPPARPPLASTVTPPSSRAPERESVPQQQTATPSPATPQDPAPAATRTPRLIADAAPRYPLIALNRRIEGRVRVAFTIRPDGHVGDLRVASSTPAEVFDKAALAAASRWRFEPSDRSHASARTLNFTVPDTGSEPGNTAVARE